MGSVIGLGTHITAFVFLVPIALTRLVRSSSLFLQNPSLFRSKPWFVLSDRPQWQSFDLYALFVSLPLAILSEALLFSSSRQNPSLRFSLALQTALLFLFWAVLAMVSLRECVDFFRPVVNDGLIFVLAGVSFVSEYWVSGKGIDGVFRDVYGLLGFLALLCGFCSFYLAVKPSSFWAEFLLSSGLVFKGTWVLQIGLSLFTQTFGIKGCGGIGKADDLDLKCELEEDGFRAVALMRLLFVLHALLAFVLGFVLFGFLANKQGSRLGDHSGSLLSQLGSENLMMSSSPELEMG